jgi:23S rRNA pseudouridine2605 synthase
MARERLQKLLAAAGHASRRAAEEWIRAGRVTVDGVRATLGESADPDRQRIAVDGRPLVLARPVYWILHKPRGVVTTLRDPEGRRTVVDLLPAGLPRLHPVGRLDRDTEGLVLLTNDGDVTQALLHPSLGSEREYRVTVRGPTAPARVGAARFDARTDESRFALVLGEGRKRQIRRAMQALGHPVVRLVRVRMGPIRLGALEPGRSRALVASEIAVLRRHAAGRHEQAGDRHASGTRRRQPRGARAKARIESRDGV